MRRRGVEPKGSAVVLDFRGREIDYPAIDQGGNRGEHNDEIICLQKYRDSLQDKREQEQAELHEEEIIEQKILELQERAGEIHGDIAAMESMLHSHLLSDDLRARIRIALEKAIVAIFYRHQHETDYLRARAEAQRQAKEIEQKREEHKRIMRSIEELQERQRQIQAQYAAARELHSKIDRMATSLTLPAAGIKLQIPLTMRFEEAAMQGRVQKQTTAELIKAVTSPPPVMSNPVQAPLQLRSSVLQVKELLARADQPKRAGAQRVTVTANISMRK